MMMMMVTTGDYPIVCLQSETETANVLYISLQHYFVEAHNPAKNKTHAVSATDRNESLLDLVRLFI